MRGFKSIFVSSKHKINCFLIQEKYFQTANAVDTLPLIFSINYIVLSYQNHVKSNFILDLNVLFKGGVLSPLFYQNSTRLRGTQLVTALASRGERRRAARPAHLAHGDGEEGGRG